MLSLFDNSKKNTYNFIYTTFHRTITTVRDNERVYTGINDTNAEGVYEFLDETKASIKEIPESEEDLFIVFAAGQPTDDTNKDHLEINGNGNFNQVAGTTTLKAMCEKEKAHCRGFTANFCVSLEFFIFYVLSKNISIKNFTLRFPMPKNRQCEDYHSSWLFRRGVCAWS